MTLISKFVGVAAPMFGAIVLPCKTFAEIANDAIYRFAGTKFEKIRVPDFAIYNYADSGVFSISVDSVCAEKV